MNFFNFLGFDVAAFEADVLKGNAENHAHFAPSDEPLGWDTRGKVVTLDAAIMAAHLMTARLIFGGMRSIVDQALRIAFNKIQSKAQELMAADAAAISGVGKRTVGLALEMVNVFDGDINERAKEQKIRKEALDAQRDLWRTALAQKRSKRKTARVLTRHAQPKQRKANRRWHTKTKSQRR